MIYQLPIEIVGIVCLNLVSLVILWWYIHGKPPTVLDVPQMFDCAVSLDGSIASWNISRVNTVLIDLRKPHHSTRNFVH